MNTIELKNACNDNMSEPGLAALAGFHCRRHTHPTLRLAHTFPSYDVGALASVSYAGFGRVDHDGLALVTVWDKLALAALTSMQKIRTELYR